MDLAVTDIIQATLNMSMMMMMRTTTTTTRTMITNNGRTYFGIQGPQLAAKM